MENVSWKDCQKFLKKLCRREGVPEGTYRLLTEAQWEYACRAGTHTAFCYGNALDSSLANFDGEYPCGGGPTGPYRQTTVAVGSFQANAWGLCEMHGNVWEWCEDGYGAYASGAVRDPLGLVPGGDRVARGGDWGTYASGCRSAIRCGFVAGNRNAMLGLRFARTTLFHPQRKEAERM